METLTMERRSEFRVKIRKPKTELWLGCVVKTASEHVSPRGMPYVKVTFENCPFVCVISGFDLMNAERLAREYDVPVPWRIDAGDTVNLNVSWRRTPAWIQEQYKRGEWEPSPKLELRSWLGLPDARQIEQSFPAEPNVSWIRRWAAKLMEWF